MLSKERLQVIREEACADWRELGDPEIVRWWRKAVRDLLSEHDRLITENAAQAPDAKLGAAVRRIPDGATLGPSRGRWYVCDDDGVTQSSGDIPDAALAAVGLMEVGDAE